MLPIQRYFYCTKMMQYILEVVSNCLVLVLLIVPQVIIPQTTML
jgi:hypothetical protein